MLEYLLWLVMGTTGVVLCALGLWIATRIVCKAILWSLDERRRNEDQRRR